MFGKKVIDPAFLCPPPSTKAFGSFLFSKVIRSWTEKLAWSVARRVIAVFMIPADTRFVIFFVFCKSSWVIPTHIPGLG